MSYYFGVGEPGILSFWVNLLFKAEMILEEHSDLIEKVIG